MLAVAALMSYSLANASQFAYLVNIMTTGFAQRCPGEMEYVEYFQCAHDYWDETATWADSVYQVWWEAFNQPYYETWCPANPIGCAQFQDDMSGSEEARDYAYMMLGYFSW